MTVSSVVRRVAVACLGTALLAVFAQPAAADGGSPLVTCVYTVNAWPGGFMANLAITNNGPAINGWTAHWTFRTATTNIGAWSVVLTQPTPFDMTATNVSYNAVIATGYTQTFGWTAIATGADIPDLIEVNGVRC